MKAIYWEHRFEAASAALEEADCRLGATCDLRHTAGVVNGLHTISFILGDMGRRSFAWTFDKLVKDCPYCSTPVWLICNHEGDHPPAFLSHSTGLLTTYLIQVKPKAYDAVIYAENRKKWEDTIGDALFEHCPVLNENVRREEEIADSEAE